MQFAVCRSICQTDVMYFFQVKQYMAKSKPLYGFIIAHNSNMSKMKLQKLFTFEIMKMTELEFDGRKSNDTLV